MKYECKSCGLECSIEANFEPTVCLKTGIICYGWHKVPAAAPKPLSEVILPKLTVEVFDREDCPEWATCAAVDSDGTAFYYPNPPERTEAGWSGRCGVSFIAEDMDASDWQNSLIKRPEKKLPDWCKVGNWVYDLEYMKYLKIVSIHNDEITVEHLYTRLTATIDSFKPARVRPWTFEEAPLCFITAHDIFTLRYNSRKSNWFYVSSKNGNEHSLTKVAKEQTQLSGEPCGVLEVGEVTE